MKSLRVNSATAHVIAHAVFIINLAKKTVTAEVTAIGTVHIIIRPSDKAVFLINVRIDRVVNEKGERCLISLFFFCPPQRGISLFPLKLSFFRAIMIKNPRRRKL